MSITLGIDMGSRTTKIVHLNEGQWQNITVFDTGHDPLRRVEEALKGVDFSCMVATGYGRHMLGKHFGAHCVTEIRACAKGVHHLFPPCRAILDVGGQDCKVMFLDEDGQVEGFEMNDRCAAGTGKFLEIMAHTFGLDLGSFVAKALSAKEPVAINSMCTVFAESEVVSLITSGQPSENIMLGLHRAIANRLQAMLHMRAMPGEVAFVGGGAKNDCLHQLLESGLKRPLRRPPNPQIVTAMGAAMLAPQAKQGVAFDPLEHATPDPGPPCPTGCPAKRDLT